MAVQYSVAVRDARNNAIETEGGASMFLDIRSGAQPANCAAADSGTLLASMALPADGFVASSAGVMSKSGTWQDASANATGTAGHWRLYKNDHTTCIAQGSCGQGSGDLSLDNTSIVAGQSVTVTAFAIRKLADRL